MANFAGVIPSKSRHGAARYHAWAFCSPAVRLDAREDL